MLIVWLEFPVMLSHESGISYSLDWWHAFKEIPTCHSMRISPVCDLAIVLDDSRHIWMRLQIGGAKISLPEPRKWVPGEAKTEE